MDAQAHCAGRAGAVQPRPRRADAPARACHLAARAYAVQSPGPARCTPPSAEDVGRLSNEGSLYVLMCSLTLKMALFDVLPYYISELGIPRKSDGSVQTKKEIRLRGSADPYLCRRRTQAKRRTPADEEALFVL